MNLADLIIKHGPYEPYALVPNEVMRFIESDQLNELRDELIAQRRLIAGKCCGFGARAYVPAVHVFGGPCGCKDDEQADYPLIPREDT